MSFRRRMMMAVNSKPYDAEIEYLQTDSRQAINTGIYPTSLDLIIEIYSQNLLRFGWAYNNNADGTWIGCVNGVVYWKNWNTPYKYSIPNWNDNTWNIWKYDMQNGLYKNNTLLKSFTASLGTNQIATYPLYLIAYYDKYTDGIKTTVMDAKIKNCKIYKNSILVRDYIPVRIGTTGYMYDKVSNQLFGNSGTGNFILGPDR